MNADPTADEMRAFLRDRWKPFSSDVDRFDGIMAGESFDIEEAIYWFAYAYAYGGQWTNLYSALSTSEYHPGRLATECEPDTIAADMLADLIEEYTNNG